ncbi:hypothetical protein [Virgibacillus soli]|uniref:Uncharacterized protein n=1 Tax=Paracerasibacillus soli TaxID=480284 RepID=A0ABU5CP24_9BACI|nr:hypothetical protein [Virgibacillus soli]MDY0408111.1 hypothetical protein [Virgibacillus soli]
MSIKDKFKNFFSVEDEYEYIEEQVPVPASIDNRHEPKVVNLTAVQQANAKMVLSMSQNLMQRYKK